jgi:hypothetical protein
MILLTAPLFLLAQAPADPAAVVAAARKALGWEALLAGNSAIEVEGAASQYETEARERFVFDGRGRFLDEFEGPLGQTNGYDGNVLWARDWNRVATRQVLGDHARAEVGALLVSGGWTAPFAPLEFALGDAGEDEVELTFTHTDGILHGTLVLAARTHLPRRATLGLDSTPQVYTFGPYIDHDGFRFPEHVRYGQHGLEQSLTVAHVRRLARAEDALFAARLAPGGEARFRAGAPATLEVKRVPTGHLLVHPLVDGKDVGWFIFDSGAGTNCLALDAAEQLELEPFGAIGARGIGGTVKSPFFRAGKLALGPLELDQPILLGLDLAFLQQHFGVEVGGILGYELLSRCVAELDFETATIALHDPAEYALPSGGHWQAALLYARHPHLHGSIEGHEGWFKIDTGAAGDTVVLHYQVVADLELLKGRETRAEQSGGVGGTVATRLGKLASFRLGTLDFGAIEAGFSLQDTGAFGDDYVFGNVGGKLFEPYRLVFDYTHERLGFVPR